MIIFLWSGGIPSLQNSFEGQGVDWVVVSSTVNPSSIVGKIGKNVDVVRYMHDLQVPQLTIIQL